ncbi:radical SAM protein [Azospirillum himalayense]|uniref:Radical SAM protein n=1 Tax=Azospirillum himalayense TaxID=654847 RepID=A0ABW0G4A2_9PROT
MTLSSSDESVLAPDAAHSWTYCSEPWQKFALTVDGNIPRCFSSPGGPAGSLHATTDLLALWNSESFQNFRAAVSEKEPAHSVCRRCPHILSVGPVPFLTDPEGEESRTPYGQNIRLQRREFESGEVVLRSLPSILHLEPSAYCNLDCIMCSQLNLKRSVNDQTVIEKFVSASAPYATLINWSGGEPLVQPSFKHFMRTFDPAGNPFLGLSLMTNGLVFDERHMEFLPKFKRAAVCVSIDGTGPVYERIRVKGEWRRLEANMKRLLILRDQYSRFGVSAAFTIQKQNVREIATFLRWCLELRLPSVFMAVFSAPVPHRPDVFNHCERETEGWRDSLKDVIALSEALDAATAEHIHPFGNTPLRATPYLSNYVNRILAAMDRAGSWPLRQVTLDVTQATERPALFVFSRDGEDVAYALVDGSAPFEVALPDGRFHVTGYPTPTSNRVVFRGKIEVA